MALNFRFWCIVPSRAGLLEIPESEMLLFSMQKMSCDENLFKHNKQTGGAFNYDKLTGQRSVGIPEGNGMTFSH